MKNNKDLSIVKVQTDDFRVGDIVWCTARGKGAVEVIHTEEKYPVVVYFDNGDCDTYTFDGKMSTSFGSFRSLFFSEPKIEASVTRPFVPTLVGKTVIAQYYDETWTTKPITITKETSEEIFTKDGSDFKSDLLAIHEVSSENLLKP